MDEEYDFVVLKFKCYYVGVGFFLLLICFGEVFILEIYFVGYFEGREMKEDSDVFFYWLIEYEKKIKELGKWSRKYFLDKVDYYSILLELLRKILFDIIFD